MSGYTLVSQQIRDLIIRGIVKVPETNLNLLQGKKRFFENEGLEKRVQPSSYEPIIGDEVFRLDAESVGLLSPRADETISRTLKQIPSIFRERKSTVGGFELRGGQTYLIPLEERINLSKANGKITHIRSSPKSSTGRLFPKTRLIADYNPYVDEISTEHSGDLQLWLIYQPLPISMIIHPGSTLNQLRFFNGDAKMSPEEIVKIEKPFLFDKDGNPIRLTEKDVYDGITLHLDLEGEATYGIAALRAKNNPDPIDLSRKGFYNPEPYFEPIKKGELIVKRGEHYLFPSKEVLKIPRKFSAELRRQSHIGIEGRSHDAGFIDNGFTGDLVFEFSPDEEARTILIDGRPLSRMDLFRVSKIPDKKYGKEIGSNYQNQMGPRTSKHFKPFGFKSAARNLLYAKKTLVQEANVLLRHRKSDEGFEFMDEDSAKRLVNDSERGWFMSRYDCENDSLILQPIPYLLIFNNNRMIFTYLRTSEEEDYGETKLFGKISFGVGGHINIEDAPNFIEKGLARKITDEVEIRGSYSEPRFVGTLFSRKQPVDTTHFGLVYAMHTDGSIKAVKKSIIKSSMFPIQNSETLSTMEREYQAEAETWTRILVPYLSKIYEIGK
jgi:deoxycytidine triphosphate deaminase/predicted NUDIX family phosphoesterase